MASPDNMALPFFIWIKITFRLFGQQRRHIETVDYLSLSDIQASGSTKYGLMKSDYIIPRQPDHYNLALYALKGHFLQSQALDLLHLFIRDYHLFK